MGRISKAIYYTVQKVRRGVTAAMVGEAADVLERPWPEIESYVRRRLERNYPAVESGFEWLTNQPVRTKADCRNAADADGDWSRRIRTERRRTSGSTGRPFRFSRDRRMIAWMDAAMWAVYAWHGIQPGDRMARFWGRPLSGVDRTKRKLVDLVVRQKRMSAFDVSPSRSSEFFEELLTWRPVYAYGYPTLMRRFVEHLRRQGRDGGNLGMTAVITTGEMLDEASRSALRDFFDCPVVNEYGCSESGILGFECEEGVPHMVPVAAFIETASRPEEPTAFPSEGRALVTDLYGHVQPFVRYDLNDAVRISPPPDCACGRALPRLEVLSGRVDSFIRTPDGGRVYDAVLAYSVPQGVVQFRVRQVAVDRLRAEVVVGHGYDRNQVVEACAASWRRAVHPEMRVEVSPAERLSGSTDGKLRYFVPLEEDHGDGIGEPGTSTDAS